MFTIEGAEWEDIVIYLSRDEAIARSKKVPKVRMEIFKKTDDGYRPTSTYFLNGEIINGS